MEARNVNSIYKNTDDFEMIMYKYDRDAALEFLKKRIEIYKGLLPNPASPVVLALYEKFMSGCPSSWGAQDTVDYSNNLIDLFSDILSTEGDFHLLKQLLPLARYDKARFHILEIMVSTVSSANQLTEILPCFYSGYYDKIVELCERHHSSKPSASQLNNSSTLFANSKPSAPDESLIQACQQPPQTEKGPSNA